MLRKFHTNRLLFGLPRLEQHYFGSLEDIMVLTYEHSEAGSLSKLESDPSWNVSEPSLMDIYSTPLHKLPTLPYADHITTNLLTNEASHIGVKTKPKGFHHKLNNPIDYTSISKSAAKKSLVDPKIEAALAGPLVNVREYSPLMSRLPAIQKVTLKVVSKKAVQDRMAMMPAFMTLASVTGIRPLPVFADYSDAKLMIREGMLLGASVELSGSSMYNFLDKMIQVVLPRMREFKGFEPVMDGRVGCVTLTLPNTAMGYFPDIEPIFDQYPKLFETTVEIKTSSQSEHETFVLLSSIQLPFLPEKTVVVQAASDSDDPWAKFKKNPSKK